MATAPAATLKFSELYSLEPEREAVCFAALAVKQRNLTRHGAPYWKLVFRDRQTTRDFMIWSDDPLLDEAAAWPDGLVFRLVVRSQVRNSKTEFKLQKARPVGPGDDGDYDVGDFYETSRYEPEECLQAIRKIAAENIEDAKIRAMVLGIIDENEAILCKIPAARSLHHAFTGGLIEHIRSMARVCCMLANHYSKYYHDLNPPLDKDIIVAAGIMHDIGKIQELEYNPIAARYTTAGNLLGHVVIGRDLVRQAAERVGGLPEETLMLLEHAILAHHGKREFGAPVIPQTIEALIVSFADDLDAKMNLFAQARLRSRGEEAFTDEVLFGPERRRIYRGIPREAPEPDGLPGASGEPL